MVLPNQTQGDCSIKVSPMSGSCTVFCYNVTSDNLTTFCRSAAQKTGNLVTVSCSQTESASDL